MCYANAIIATNKDGLKTVTTLLVYYLQAPSEMLFLFYFLLMLFFKADPVMKELHQTQHNSNHWSIKKKTLVELKGTSVSSDYKLMKI